MSIPKGIGGLAAIGLVTLGTWALSSAPDTNQASAIAQCLGGLALAGFAAMMVITTRLGLVDRWFCGLDKAYTVHKWLAVTSMTLALAHILLISLAQGGAHRGAPRQDMATMLTHAGGPAIAFFILLAVVAVAGRKLRYERWQNIHKLMGLPYLMGLAHYYGSSTFGAFGASWFSIWMDVVNVIGVAAWVYTVFFYQRAGFPYRYRVEAVRQVGTDTVEISCQPKGKALVSRAGQFAFIKADLPGGFGPHPFTISSGAEEQTLQFSVKALGDHTAALAQRLAPGDELAISGPYGQFDYTLGASHQLWVAGGIGITPFRSFYRSGLADGFSVDLFYAFHGDDAPYRDEVAALDGPMLRTHLIDDTVQGFLTAEMIEQAVDGDGPYDVYFTGPTAMLTSLRASLGASRLRIGRYHFEQFAFRG